MNGTRNTLINTIDIKLSTVDHARFWARVDKSTEGGCWLWTGAKSSGGYGQVSQGRKGAKLYAHRVSFAIARGSVPSGYPLDHLCRVRLCVNPSHLEPVTPRENVLRGIGQSAIHARKTYCVNGHEFTDENTYRDQARNARSCRECRRIRDRKRTCGWERQRIAASKSTIKEN